VGEVGGWRYGAENRGAGADDVHFAEAVLRGALAASSLSTRPRILRGTWTRQDPISSQVMAERNLSPSENASESVRINEAVGPRYSARRRPLVGVNVVQLIVGTEAETGSDGTSIRARGGKIR